jgi:hypothetical protein
LWLSFPKTKGVFGWAVAFGKADVSFKLLKS